MPDSRASAGFITFYSWLAVCMILLMPVLCVPVPRILGTLPAIIGGLGLCMLLLYQKKNFWLPFWACLGCLAMWLGLSTFLNTELESASGFAQTRFLKLAGGIIGGFGLVVGAQTLPQKQRRFFGKTLPCAVALGAALLLVEYFFDSPLYRILRGISFSETVKDAEVNRGMVTLALLLWPALAVFSANQTQKTGALLLGGFVVAALLACPSSQSAQAGIIAGLICFAGAKLRPRLFLPAATALLCLGLLASPWIAMKLYETKPAMLWEWKAAAARQRITLWNAVAEQALEKPLTGHGIEATRLLSPEIKARLNSKLQKRWKTIWHPHNGALQIWLEAGLAGVFLVIALFWLLLGRIKALPETLMPYAFAAFCTATTIALTGYGLWQGWWIGILFIAGAAFVAMEDDSAPSTA